MMMIVVIKDSILYDSDDTSRLSSKVDSKILASSDSLPIVMMSMMIVISSSSKTLYLVDQQRRPSRFQHHIHEEGCP